jgi:hypothetical protein
VGLGAVGIAKPFLVGHDAVPDARRFGSKVGKPHWAAAGIRLGAPSPKFG